jgi:hypothetical protein
MCIPLRTTKIAKKEHNKSDPLFLCKIFHIFAQAAFAAIFWT